MAEVIALSALGAIALTITVLFVLLHRDLKNDTSFDDLCNSLDRIYDSDETEDKQVWKACAIATAKSLSNRHRYQRRRRRWR